MQSITDHIRNIKKKRKRSDQDIVKIEPIDQMEVAESEP